MGFGPTLPYLGDTLGQLLARVVGLAVVLLGAALALEGSFGTSAGALFIGGGVAARPTLLTGSLKRGAEFVGFLFELG